MYRKDNIRRISHCAQLVLYLAILLNGVIFRHSHVMANGAVISHAHPYQSSGDPTDEHHHHSETDLLFLDLISSAPHHIAEVLIEPLPAWTNINKQELREKQELELCNAINESLRGPPMTC